MVMMSSINPSIDDYLAVMSTDRGSAFSKIFSRYCLSSFGSKVLCGELIFPVSQHSPLSILFPRYIDASLIVVYSSGGGVVPNGGCRHRKDSLSTIVMQVDAIVAFSSIRW